MAYSMAVRSCVLAVMLVLAVAPGAYAAVEGCSTDLIQAMKNNPDLSIFVQVIDAADLEDRLSKTNNATLLAPRNDAFNGTNGLYPLLQANNLTLEQVTGDNNRAGSIILYHIIPGSPLTINQLSDNKVLSTGLYGATITVDKVNTGNTVSIVIPFTASFSFITSLVACILYSVRFQPNHQMSVSVFSASQVRTNFIGRGSNATVTSADLRVCNNIVHIINRVLLPNTTLSAVPGYDDDTPTPGIGAASSLAIGTWVFALTGALAAALSM
uniref:FAS1 domain-containing protein n=1 Tax=Physcomitrium patens TaxID=3218 RepID=A0A7I4A1L1_PHYPA|nr:uncharacterized protein sll1483-like isoform X1 [Physcomitrium patens]|eukprot:XP_024386113.1 uncharacterized protein sll1483-like isoform X1 [Physcomitrella patens]